MQQKNYNGLLTYGESIPFDVPVGTSKINIKNWSQSTLRVLHNGVKLDIAGMNAKGVEDYKIGDKMLLENISSDETDCYYEIVFWL